MCLDNSRICVSFPKTAWKVCKQSVVGPFSETPRRNGVWMTAKIEYEHKLSIDYPPGFHVFETKDGAEHFIDMFRPTKPLMDNGMPRRFEWYSTKVCVEGPATKGTSYGHTAYAVNKIKFGDTDRG